MDWSLAPPPRVVDGLLAVPIDITDVVAEVIFDAATQTCGVDATVDFTVGPTAGNPDDGQAEPCPRSAPLSPSALTPE